MNVTTTAASPPDTTTPVIPNPPGSHDYLFVLGFFLTTILLFTITYVSYICNRSRSSSSSPSPPPSSDTADGDASDRRLIGFSRGLDDDVLVTFPTSIYSETKIPNKFGTDNVVNGSGCSICLADYMPADVVRVLPECGHLFHVGCIDTWLKSHPTCPMCRKAPLAGVNKNHN